MFSILSVALAVTTVACTAGDPLEPQGLVSDGAAGLSQAPSDPLSADQPQVRFQPAPTVPFADAVAEWQARDPHAFAWAEAFVKYAPPHARLVTLDDRRPGTPAPGSIWWPLDPEGWVYISSRELVELETARGLGSQGDALLPDGTALRSRQVFQAQYATWEAAESLCDVSATVLTVGCIG